MRDNEDDDEEIKNFMCESHLSHSRGVNKPAAVKVSTINLLKQNSTDKIRSFPHSRINFDSSSSFITPDAQYNVFFLKILFRLSAFSNLSAASKMLHWSFFQFSLSVRIFFASLFSIQNHSKYNKKRR
jgi:hypothetical protein